MEASARTGGLIRRRLPVVLVAFALVGGVAACRPGTRPPVTTPTTTDPGGPPTTDPGPGPGGGRLPLNANDNARGSYAVTTMTNAGGSTVWRPTTLGANGVKHPIFVWGTGATANPARYNDHFTQMASHGFVVISPNTTNVNANLLKSSLSWIIAQNSAPGSVFNGKLNTSEIAMGGHSLGSVSTFNAEQTLNNLKTTIHIAGGSFDGQGSSKVKTPTAYMCGGSGDIAKPQCDTDFNNVRSQPTYYTVLRGIDHIGAARAALPAMIAWLRWHLNGETNRKAQFSPGGTYFSGIFESKVKNWN
jgi:hypothetical protein